MLGILKALGIYTSRLSSTLIQKLRFANCTTGRTRLLRLICSMTWSFHFLTPMGYRLCVSLLTEEANTVGTANIISMPCIWILKTLNTPRLKRSRPKLKASVNGLIKPAKTSFIQLRFGKRFTGTWMKSSLTWMNG
jgi:hypothetical protein